MELRVVDDYAALSRAGAAWVAGALAAEPDAAVVLATGNTPLGLYEELAAWRRRGAIDLARARVFQLDAYLGLDRDDPRSLYGWLDCAFLAPLGVPEARVVALPGGCPGPGGSLSRLRRRRSGRGRVRRVRAGPRAERPSGL